MAASSVGNREQAVLVRETSVGEREVDASSREVAVSEGEALAVLRDAALRAREETEMVRLERDRLLVEMRASNEQLALAVWRAAALEDEAAAARATIAASEKRFRSLVMTSAALVFHADAAGRIGVGRESWRRFTGLELDANEPEGWLCAVHPDERAATAAAWARAVAGRQGFTHQHRLCRREGGYTWVAARAVPVLLDGAILEWIGMMTDISDRMRIETAREQFIAILGHDLRNPLSAILGTAHMLVDGGPPSQAKAIARIIRNANRIESLIEDVLDFARGRLGGGIPIKAKPGDLLPSVLEEVAGAKVAHPDRAITSETSGDLSGHWDLGRLEQVMSNLINNAIRHGIDPIHVEARQDGEDVVLTFRNQGPPIPVAILPSMFEPFRRRVGQQVDGLGLGLYIASEIVRAHGGEISVRSGDGDGTTFVIRLPRRAPDPAR